MKSFLFFLHRNKFVLKSDWDQQDYLSLISWRLIALKVSKIRYALGYTGVSQRLSLDAFLSQQIYHQDHLRNSRTAHKRSPFKPGCISGDPARVLLPRLLLPSSYSAGTFPTFPVPRLCWEAGGVFPLRGVPWIYCKSISLLAILHLPPSRTFLSSSGKKEML